MEVVALLSQGRTAAAQCGLFTHKSVPVIFEPPCTKNKKSKSRSYGLGVPRISVRFLAGETDFPLSTASSQTLDPILLVL